MTILSRDQFRNAVFERDNHLCVVCKFPAVDAHHIMERRLFTEPDELGGYFLDNGASVCEICHIKAEETIISTDELRQAAGIKKIILPHNLYEDQIYDKWGNIVLPNNQRLKGELFEDVSVQKILGKVKHLFTDYVKYPRTYHLPWSLGMHDDDRMHTSSAQWKDMDVVVTLKMDGENTTMYRDYIHARSIDSRNHPSRNWVKNFWASIAYEIPEGWRVCGENLYAKHSITYNSLPSYFTGFSIWNNLNYCLSWDETLEFFKLLGIIPVKVLYEGKYNEEYIRNLKLNYETDEGYVIRPKKFFHYKEFKNLVGKFVRPDHIKTTKHWMHGQEMERNTVCVY